MPRFNDKIQQYLILACLVSLSFFASIKAERLPVKIYTSADGLGSSFVDSVYRDSRGFIWACTRDGLSRFDGARFVNYQIGEKNSPPGIENIFETRNGKYLISTTGGTFLFNPDSVSSNDSVIPHLKAERISPIRGRFIEDDKGNVWMGETAIFQLVEENGKVEFRQTDWGIPPQPREFLAYFFDRSVDGSIWVYTSWGLVRRLPNERIVVYHISRPMYEGGGAYSLLADKNGYIWLAVLDEVYLIKPEPIESFADAGKVTVKMLNPTSVIEIKPKENVPMPEKSGEVFQYTNPEHISKYTSRRFFQTSDGTVWITAVDTLLKFEKGILHAHGKEQGLPNSMALMAEDEAGNLWIGGYNGLARLDRHGIVTYGVSDGAAASQFYAINESIGGTLYFANGTKNITHFDGEKFQTASLAIPPNPTHAWTSRHSLIDSSGDFWFLTNGKLYRFSGVKDFSELKGKPPAKIYTSADGLKSDRMFQIFEDKYGDIWVSTRGVTAELNGLARLKKGEDKFRAFTEAEDFPAKVSASSFAEDKSGHLWVSFYEGGLARFNGEKFEVVSDKENYPAAGLISDLHLDKQGRLWFSTATNGLFRIDNPGEENLSYFSMTTENGLTSNNIRTITEDRFGRIYIGTARGIDRISPDTGQIKHYSVNDGLATDFVIDSHCDRHGNLWFATNNGLSRLVPLPEGKIYSPRIFIGSLRIAGEQEDVSELGSTKIEKGELEPTQNNLQIEFFGLDFRAGENLRYQYKLEGADTDWSPPTELRTVTFANLSPETYRFLVRAVNSEGIVSENPAVVSFKILPPIYARWWFIALCLLAVGFVITAFYRSRLTHLEQARRAEENLRKSKEERLAELEKVRSRIATDLHDDIGASLTQIAVLSEVAQAQSKGNGATEPLTKISAVSNELVGTMSDIVWSINPAKDHLSDLTQRMRRFASDVLAARGIAFHFVVPDANEEIKVNTNVRREVFLIFKESINNIAKHSAATQAEIELSVLKTDLRLKITDNGKGFDPEKISENAKFSTGGNGVLSIQRRAREMGGELQLISAAGNGTTVNLCLPLEQKQTT
jgi:signal transduction histidine kinase/ligand-binding sensor domain-containing protein